MKRLFKFGELSGDSICKGIFITSLLILFRFLYFNRISISVHDSNIKMFFANIGFFYIRYLEPIVILIWLKFICEFLFNLLQKEHSK